MVPLLADGLALGGAVVRRRAITHRGFLSIQPDATAQTHGAEDGSSTASEAHGLGDRVVPAGCGVERTAEVLQARAPREDADAERVLDMTPATDAGHEVGDLLAVERVDPRGQPQLGHVHRHAALKGARRPGAGVEHLLPAPAMIVAARRRALQGVDRRVLGLATEPLGGALHTLGEEIAEPLALDDHLQQTVGALDIAPLEIEAHLLLREPALLEALHYPADHPAELIDVDTGPVALRVEPGDALLIGGADRPAAARPSLVLRLVDDRALVGA